MKCPACGGAIIHDPGCHPFGPEDKCVNCGRRLTESKNPGAPDHVGCRAKERKIMEEKKTCIKCGKELPKTDEFFRKNTSTKDGFEGQCKNCRQKYFEDYRAGKRTRRKYRKLASDPAPKERTVRRGTNSMPAGPIVSASPTEIVIALRKGMAAEIVAMINERYEL